MKFKEFLKLLESDKGYKQSAGSDLADSIGLMIIMALVVFVIFI